MIANPALVNASTIAASEHIFGAGLLGCALMQSGVLIGAIHAIRITIANPFLWYTLSTTPRLVFNAGEFCFFVAFPFIALMPVILVTVVQTIVIAVTNINARYTVAVITSEQVSEARATLRLAIFRWLISPITTVVVTVAIPSRWNASVIGATETVCWASALSAMERIFVRVITAVVVTIAQPVRFHADVSLLTLQMVRRASCVGWTTFMRFI